MLTIDSLKDDMQADANETDNKANTINDINVFTFHIYCQVQDAQLLDSTRKIK